MKGMELLGLEVEDKVTKVSGIVTSISYDLYGCIQAVITPDAETNNRDSVIGWYDIKRLRKLTETPIMSLPNWDEEEIGCGDKPIR